jgi:hypothetical protein
MQIPDLRPKASQDAASAVLSSFAYPINLCRKGPCILGEGIVNLLLLIGDRDDGKDE